MLGELFSPKYKVVGAEFGSKKVLLGLSVVIEL